MTPRRRPRSARSFAAVGLLLMLVGHTGCRALGDAVIDSLLGTDRGYSYHNDYRPTQAPEPRRWTLLYTEHLQLSSDLLGVHAVVNGHEVGPCPVTVPLPPRSVGIEETGFYPVQDVYELKYKEQEHGPDRFISERYLRTERVAGPTRWVGHRVVSAELPPLTVAWVRDGQTLGTSLIPATSATFTLKTAPPEIDPVLLNALRRLEWNRPITDPAVPGEAAGVRTLHWPPPPEAEPETATLDSADPAATPRLPPTP